MKQAIYHVRLDVRRSGSQALMRIKQGENISRKIVFSLANGSQPMEYSREDAVILRATKPDGTQLLNECDVSGTSISYVIGEQMTAAAGTIYCDLLITGSDGSIMYSPGFDVVVEADQFDNEHVESTDEFNALADALSKVQVVYVNEEARVEAETERQDAETLREEAETRRESKLSRASASIEMLEPDADAYVNAEMTEENGVAFEFGIPRSDGGIYFETDETLVLEDGILRVNTTDKAEADNTQPITSAGVHTIIGNINAILRTI